MASSSSVRSVLEGSLVGVGQLTRGMLVRDASRLGVLAGSWGKEKIRIISELRRRICSLGKSVGVDGEHVKMPVSTIFFE